MVMQAVREEQEVESNVVAVHVPDEFLHLRVMVTVQPLAKKEDELDPDAWPPGYFEHYAGCLPDFPDIESEGDYEVREPLASTQQSV